MKQEEIQTKSQQKVKAITTLCEQLQIIITAEQVITEKGLIKQVVYYNDTENYDVDKEPLTPQKNEEKPKV